MIKNIIDFFCWKNNQINLKSKIEFSLGRKDLWVDFINLLVESPMLLHPVIEDTNEVNLYQLKKIKLHAD